MYEEPKDATQSTVLPPADLTRKLFDLFFRYVTPFFPVVDQVAFEAQYMARVHEKEPQFARLVHLVCALGSVYCPDDPRVFSAEGSMPGLKFFRETKDRRLYGRLVLTDVQCYIVSSMSVSILTV